MNTHFNCASCHHLWVALVVKNPLANAGDARDLGPIPGSGNATPIQYYCLENSMDRERSLVGSSMESQKVGHD